MSYTVVPTEPKRRPGVVSAAVALLYLVAALQLVSVGLSALTIGPIRDVYSRAYAGTGDEELMSNLIMVGLIAGIVVGAAFAVGFAVLAIFDGRGKNPARIVTWVIAGLGVLCYSCSLASQSVGNAFSGFGSNADRADLPDPNEVAKQAQDAIPAWQTTFATIDTVVFLVALVAVIILLALPAANAFFRKETEVWVPPTQWPAAQP
ncbi:MAG: hypothetical protein ACM30G_23360 [Micromonosporaceae bacterium]